jgi:hypothetical protein
MSLRAAYEAGMAKAIDDAKEGCREIFGGNGPWLSPPSLAIHREVRNCLDCLPSVLVDIVVNEYGDFVDAEYFIDAFPYVFWSVNSRVLFRNVLMMAIALDNFAMFSKFGARYGLATNAIPNDYYAEFSEFRKLSSDPLKNMFIKTVINVICYCGRGELWLDVICPCTGEMYEGLRYTGFKYMLMGSGPVREIVNFIKTTRLDTLPRSMLVELAMGPQEGWSDANPDIIEFLERF